MRLQVNGEQRSLSLKPEPSNLQKVIETLGHNPKTVVVEFNGSILSPDYWPEQEVKDGDNLEIVTIVGGGS